MSFKNFISNIFFKDKMTGQDAVYYSNLEATIFYKEFAIQSCISIIANALSMCEFKTYENGKEVRKNNYYALNVSPNKNQNAVEFWKEAISTLIYENETLIVQIGDEFFVADPGFKVDTYVYYEDVYRNVVVRDYTLPQSFTESDVFYFKLNNEDIKRIIDGLYQDYKNLLGSSIGTFKKNNGRRGILNIDSMYPQTQKAKEQLDDLLDNKFKKYFESENAVLPLSKGLSFTESTVTKTQNSRDIRDIINDVIDFVCSGFHVPAAIVKGDTVGVEAMTENFVNFGLNPIAKLLCTEINKKLYTKEQYLNRNYVRVNTKYIIDAGLSTVSKAAELLFRIGVNSIDDNLELVGEEPINEDWSKEHYVSKNYQAVVNKGGGDNGEKNS